jgi:hypothetical protein
MQSRGKNPALELKTMDVTAASPDHRNVAKIALSGGSSGILRLWDLHEDRPMLDHSLVATIIGHHEQTSIAKSQETVALLRHSEIDHAYTSRGFADTIFEHFIKVNRTLGLHLEKRPQYLL